MSGGVISAADAAARVGVAGVCVAIAGAGSAGGKAPVTRQATITLPTVSPAHTVTLTGQLIAK